MSTKTKVRAPYACRGLAGTLMTPAEFDAFIAGEMDKWGKVIREAHVKAE